MLRRSRPAVAVVTSRVMDRRAAGRCVGWALSGLLALAAAGCAPSEEEIKAHFTAYVETANACAVASECGLAEAACPLDCVGVRAERVADVEAKARELIKDWERGDRKCYGGGGCSHQPARMVFCVSNRCLWTNPGTADAGSPDAGALGDLRGSLFGGAVTP